MFRNFKETVYFLLVDDRDENLLSLESLLRRDGLECLKARSGTEALELLLQYDVALALLDVQMPGMDGFELAELMRGTERTRNVPIIFLTAGSNDAQRRFRGYEAGAVDFIQKPIETDVLRHKTNIFFDLHRQHRLLEIQRDQLMEKSDALEKADKRKDEYIATLAHELRNPLSPIKSGLQLLRRADSQKAGQVMDIIERQTDHLLRLVDDLLDISRFSQGKIELKKQEMTLQSAVKSAIEASQPTIDAKGHRFECDVPDDNIWLNADPTRMAQIISNLLNNAAKYTPEGGNISLTAKADGKKVTLRVMDNGLGIPPHLQSGIFDVFAQVESAQHRQSAQGGLGIGLSLVKNLVTLHGGRISVESAGSGQGSTFTIELPCCEQPAVMHDAPRREAAQPVVESACLRILVVDDNVPAAQTIGWMLEAIGHSPILAHSGHEALAAASNDAPDVILLDIGLPDKNGYEVCREMRQNPVLKNTLIVAQTGWGQEKDRREAFEAGFNHHLVKPVGMQDFLDILTPKAAAS